VIAIANQKGGVGKSTTAVSLGAALAEMGFRVLVVDLDPQGNASTGLGIRHEARETTVYDVIVAEAPAAGAIVPTAIEGLHAIPSTIDLAGAEIELVSQFSRETRLKRALEPVRTGAYHFILLDCPPSLGLLTINALTAAEELIVPIQCEYYALEGLGQLLRNVTLVQQNINPDLRISGIVLTMFDSRTKLSEQVVAEVRTFFGDLVYDVIIPRSVRLSEAPGFGQPITVYDPRSKGALTYRELAREVADRAAPSGPLPSLERLPTVAAPPPGPGPAPPPDAEDLEDLPVPRVRDLQPTQEAPAPPEEDLGTAGPPTPERDEGSEGRERDRDEGSEGSEGSDERPAVAAVEAGGLQGAPDDPLGPTAAVEEAADELWEEAAGQPAPRVRRPRARPDEMADRRVVVIDEGVEEELTVRGRHDAPPPLVEGADESPTSIGATLEDEPPPRRRRWRLFRKGGE
jgi:chromosome partitioning protein